MPANKETVSIAIKEAERFLQRARAVRFNEHGDPVDFTQTGACKRASMDLTRALANIRKSR